MRLLTLCGSLQARSSNQALLDAAIATAPPGVEFTAFDGLRDVPLFSPERDVAPAPAAVAAWRSALAGADAVLIATPEYAHGYPGALKNALDWVVGSGEFSGKPVGLVSASTGATGGIRALLGLTQVILAMDAPVVEAWGVALVKTRLDAEGRLVDAPTIARLRGMTEALKRASLR
jgi:NAD(P)H-dependent FMN reductase